MFWCSNQTMPKCPHCFIIFRGAEQELFQVIWTYIVVDRLLKLWILSTLLIGVINLPNCNTEVKFLEQVPSRSGLCCMRRCTWLMDEWMNKREQDDLCSHFSFSFLLLRSHQFIILSFHISCLSFPRPLPVLPLSSPQPPPPPPPLPSPLHQGSCGLSERQTNEGPRRAAPALPHITHSLSITHTRAHTQTGPASLCPIQAVPPGCHGNLQSVLPLRPDCAWARAGWSPGWVKPHWSLPRCATLCHAVPCCAMPRQVNLLRPLHN